MQGYPALVLNADFRPLSYFPLSLLSWQDTVTAVFKDEASLSAGLSARKLARLSLLGQREISIFS